MLDQALFVTTDPFEVTKPKEHFINDRCFGEDFAEWLRPRLGARRIACDLDPCGSRTSRGIMSC